MAERRVFAGYYKRYDGKPIFVVRVFNDIDTGEAIVVCKDASFSREDNEHYYLIRYASFCEKVEVDGELRDKYIRQTRREIDTSIVREVYEDGFPEPKSKRFPFVDDEYEDRFIRCSQTYCEYAKDICGNYRMDLQRYRLIRERRQYIGVHDCAPRLRGDLQKTLFRGAVHPQNGGRLADESRGGRTAAECAVSGVRRASSSAGRGGRHLPVIAGNR